MIHQIARILERKNEPEETFKGTMAETFQNW